jgi:thioredoxin 1
VQGFGLEMTGVLGSNVRQEYNFGPWRVDSYGIRRMSGGTTLSDKIVYVTDDTFDAEVINADGTVLVDYWADWCGPCKMIAPILDEIAEDYADKLKVVKLNIDENPNTPPKFGIRGIPTLMLFKGGNVEATKVGAVSKSQLTAFIDSNL